MSDLAFTPITTLAAHIRSRAVSPVELVMTLLNRIERLNPLLKSYITVCHESVLTAARAAEQEISAGHYRGPLHGIPVAHKDISLTKGVRTTAHSKTLLDFIPSTDATHVRKLEAAGMILLGKTNTTEFACGDMAEFGFTPNPWNLERFSGASSGGSASAIVAGLAVATTGTDTGGSIRAPAGFCGMVGVKPTFGRVSRNGVIPLSWTMDHAGPMTRTVKDAALMLSAMSGYDPLDPSSADEPVPDFSAALTPHLKGVVIGIPENYFFDDLTPAVAKAVNTALTKLSELGAELRAVRLPMAAALEPIGSLLVGAEAFSQHADRLRRHAPDYGPKARCRIAIGAFFTAAEYQQALQLRRLWISELEAVLQQVDALVTPTLPFTAFLVETQAKGPPDTSWGTRHFNLSGHPAMTVPCGFDQDGLPIGLQIAAKAFDEAMMFRVAHAYEQSTAWHLRRPEHLEAVA
jgi:aspartyl-tRNA(Asn)/glutamyl-tRNA(Gln) amidotransferase subunit A